VCVCVGMWVGQSRSNQGKPGCKNKGFGSGKRDADYE